VGLFRRVAERRRPPAGPGGTDLLGQPTLHRRQLLGAAGAVAAASISTTRLLAPTPAPETDAEEDDDEEVEDPRSGLRRLIWSVETDAPRAALTFDDGPHPALTPRILDLLDRHGITATFMAMGHAAERYPGLMAEIVAAGHEIGHHTWHHKNLARASARETRDEIDRGVELVEEAAGRPARLFRPPQGRLSEAAVRLVARHGHDIVLWSVTRGRLSELSSRRIADHLVGSIGRGDIIDLHDGIGRGTFAPNAPFAVRLMDRRLSEVAALPEMIERVGARGIRLGTIWDLLAVRSDDGGRRGDDGASA